MAFNKAPSNWITGWTVVDGNIVIPLATFPQLTEAEAHASTGDIRKIMFAFLRYWKGKWTGTAAADRPAMLASTFSATTDSATDIKTEGYNFSLKSVATVEEILDEPA